MQNRTIDVSFCTECPEPQTSAAGSTACSFCRKGFYTEPGTSEVSCAACPAQGAACPANSTLRSIAMLPGFWRLSPRSREPSRCLEVDRGNESVTACRGGADAGADGRGYCMPGHLGPKCQVCDPSHFASRVHFNHEEGVCSDCPDPLIGVGIPAAAALVAALLARLAVLACQSPPRPLRACVWWLRRQASKLLDLQLLPRVKQLINFYQIVVVMPAVYSLPPLPGWYTAAMRPMTWIDLSWTQYVLPGACIGYRERLLLRGLGPLLLLAALPLGYGAYEATQALRRRGSRGFAVKTALLSALPALLFVSFCLCPSVSAGIFATYGCDSYTADSDAGEVWFFLREDPSVVCSRQSADFSEQTPEHAALGQLALVFVCVWPVGLPACYALLLFLCRKNILQRRQTRLVVATEVLHKEYAPDRAYPLTNPSLWLASTTALVPI